MASPQEGACNGGSLVGHHLGKGKDLCHVPQLAKNEGLKGVPPLTKEGQPPFPPGMNGPLGPAEAVLPREADGGGQGGGKGDAEGFQIECRTKMRKRTVKIVECGLKMKEVKMECGTQMRERAVEIVECGLKMKEVKMECGIKMRERLMKIVD